MRDKAPLLCQLGLRDTKYSAASAGDQMACAQLADTETTRACTGLDQHEPRLECDARQRVGGETGDKVRGLAGAGTCGSGRLSGRESMQGEWRWSSPKVERKEIGNE